MGLSLSSLRARWRASVGWKVAFLLVLGCCGLAGAAGTYVRGKLLTRRENHTLAIPLSAPGGSTWRLVSVFPGVRFHQPVSYVPIPGEPGNAFVLERAGRLQLLDGRGSAPQLSCVLDFSARTVCTPDSDDGALGLVLHPRFAAPPGDPQRGSLYVLYTARNGTDMFDRVSRFTFDFSQRTIVENSELVLIDQRDRHTDHNGGGMAFGDDGFLYVGVGDEGGDADQYANGQRLDGGLFGGILRLDVDSRGEPHSAPAPRHPANGRTANYFIPRDNPFWDVPNALPEFWSLGLRNPHRLAFDSETGRLWVGEVGHLLREEIELAARGTNHQWSYREGRLPFAESYLHGARPEKLLGVETPPAWEYPHVNGNNCVIGGFVYRGDQWPELVGKYLFADNVSGRLFAATVAGEGISRVDELACVRAFSKSGIASVDPDHNGEPLVMVLGESNQATGEIYRLEAAAPSDSWARLPQRLSETGLFADTTSLRPAAGMVEYQVNLPQWTDGMSARHWILVPGRGRDPDPATDRIRFSPQGAWQFPSGTVFVQHLELPAAEVARNRTSRLETRLLVRDQAGQAFGLNYQWEADGSDAILVAENQNVMLEIVQNDGRLRHQTWTHLSGQSCSVCHNPQAGFVLGVSARQLNRDELYPLLGGRRSQLEYWSRIGMFTQELTAEDLQASSRLVPPSDTSVDLAVRVDSYLDVNCSACHLPGGLARAHFDARFPTPLPAKKLVCGPVYSTESLVGAFAVRPGDPARSLLVHRLQHSLKRMPPIGSQRRDSEAIQLFSDWIDTLPVPADIDDVLEESADGRVGIPSQASSPGG